jgi:hypothetical protein
LTTGLELGHRTPQTGYSVYRRHTRIEVTNSLPQLSHDQSCSTQPLALNRDSSATSKTLPQRGQFGRLKFAVARVRAVGTWQVDWTIIVDSPRRPSPHPFVRYHARNLWRCRDAIVKLLWLWIVPPAARCGAIAAFSCQQILKF